MCSQSRKNHPEVAPKSAARRRILWARPLLYGALAALTIVVTISVLTTPADAVALTAAGAGQESVYQQSDDEPVGNGRRLDDLYAGRAFSGAPPVVPHAVDETDFDGEGCLQCHGEGSFVPRMQAYAPLTPHPAMTACWQCHVAIRPPDAVAATDKAHDPQADTPPPAIPHEVELTRNCLGCHSIPRAQAIDNCRQCHVATTPDGVSLYDTLNWMPWQPARKPVLLPGAPPAIPHDMQMRTDCLVCHTGPTTAVELQVSHPERTECQQCHLPILTSAEWEPER